jgi:hypothetical protein
MISREYNTAMPVWPDRKDLRVTLQAMHRTVGIVRG